MRKDNIIDKIRKLLAMADKNSGASENEMMTAMAMAVELRADCRRSAVGT